MCAVQALNPYTAGNPIGEASAFFGRQDVLKQVRQVLRNRRERAIVLFGQRRIGKTSVLLQLERELERTGTATAVYFDLQDKAGKPLADVLYQLAQRIAAKAVVENPSRNDFDGSGVFFRESFLPTAAKSIGERGLVLLFDEFDVLDSPMERRAGQTFFPYLRGWMDTAQGVRFVFVIGRRPEDLSIETVSAFKGVRAARVSLLEPDAARSVIRQSEQEGGVPWTDAAVEDVLALTRGHPYLTQLLCSVVWENAFEQDPAGSRGIEPSLVDEAVDDALRQGANAFQWIWDGLPPAERVVIAAMAEAPSPVIRHEELIDILNRSGVRLIVRELELAPETLVEWELLRAESDGYTFTVPLFRRWVAKHRPLRRAKDELDRIDPLAEALFQTGNRFYGLGKNDEAQSQLRQALTINPNHLKSRLLLGRILLETEHADESVRILEEAYVYDRPAARADLIRALLAWGEGKEEDEQSRIYARILEIDAEQPIARERLQHIQTVRRERQLMQALQAGEEHEAAESWSAAVDVYQNLLNDFPNHEDVLAHYARARARSDLAQRYAEALAALDGGQQAAAQQLLAQVIAESPTYKEAARHLVRATVGVDVASLVEELKQTRQDLASITDQYAREVAELESQKRRADAAEEEAKGLKQELTKSRLRSEKERAAQKDVIEKLRTQLAVAEAPPTVVPTRVTPSSYHTSPPASLLPAVHNKPSRDRIVKTLALAREGEMVVCPICSLKMKREKLIAHASEHD